MKRFSFVARVALVVSVFAFGVASDALAGKTCASGCRKNLKVCKNAVNVERHGCLWDCQVNNPAGPARTACNQACNAARVADKAACNSTYSGVCMAEDCDPATNLPCFSAECQDMLIDDSGMSLGALGACNAACPQFDYACVYACAAAGHGNATSDLNAFTSCCP